MSSGRGRGSHHNNPPQTTQQYKKYFQTSNYQGDAQQQSYNPGQSVGVGGGPNTGAPPVARFPQQHDIKQQQQQQQQQQQAAFQSQTPIVSVSPMYQQQQYQGQGGPGNGPSMHQQHHHAAPQQQQATRQNYYQAPRMPAPNHQGPRMPHLQNNAPRGPMGQGMTQQPGLNGPPEVSYLGGGNGHIPQVPPTGPPPTPQNQAALSQQQQHQQHNVYTITMNQQQQPIIMLHNNNHPLAQFQQTNLRPPGHPQQFPGAPHQFMSSGVHNPGGPQQVFFTPGMQGMPPMPQYHQVPLTFTQQHHPVPLPGQMIHFQQQHMGPMQPHLIQQQQQQQPQQQPQQPTGPAPGGQPRPLPTPTPPPNQVGPQQAMNLPHVGVPPNSMMAPNIPQMMTFPQPMLPAGVIRPSAALPQKRRSHAIQIVDPDSGTVIDPLAGKPTPDNVASLTSHAEESGTETAPSSLVVESTPIIITSPITNEQIDLTSTVSKKFEELSVGEKTVVVSRSRTSSETVDKRSDAVVENVVVTLSETPPAAAAPSVVTQAATTAVAAPAPLKIHSVNSNNVTTSEAISQPPTVAASSPSAESVTTDSKTPSRTTPPTGSLEYEPVSPTPLTDTPKSNNDEAKSKNIKKKNNAAKKAELNQKVPMASDMDAFKDLSSSTTSTTSTAYASPATTPDTTVAPPLPPTVVEAVNVAPAPSKTSVVEKSSTENHVDLVRKEISPPPVVTAAAEPEVIVSQQQQPEVSNNNHVGSEASESTAVNHDEVEDEKVSENLSSKSGSQVKLRYDYKENQWSPINLEGKKQYDRGFLLLLQTDPLSLERPPNLPNMDIIKDKSMTMNVNKVAANSAAKDWMPGFIKTTMNARQASLTKKPSRDSRDVRDGNKRPMMMQPPPKIIDVKIEKVELHQTENAWKPAKLSETTNVESQSPNDVLLRKARGILNKLCPQKFDILVEKFNTELQIDSEEKLRLCMELVFEKAVDEPGFSVAYARMCDVLQKKQVTTDVNGAKQPVNFRKLLVSRCQQEFERDYLHGLDKAKYEADLLEAGNDEAKKKTVQADWEEKEMRARRRSLGNIRFIGELYKLKMLTARIMHECIKKLLKSTDEESLECLSRLLTTVGKDLEQETSDKIGKLSNAEASKTGLAPFDYYFKDIERIINSEKSISSRVKFMLQDLVDLRRNYWKPRRDVAGPKTIEQIHKEAEREKTQNQLLNEMTPMRNRDGGMQGGGPPGMRGGPNDRKKSSRGPNQTSEDGWTPVQPSKVSQRSNNYDRIDTHKIANLAQSSARRSDGEISLGRPSGSTWAAGSGSMRLSRTKEEPAPEVSRGRFYMPGQNDSGPASLGGGYPGMPPPSHDNRYEPRRLAGGSSRSMGMPGSGSRGPSVESERKRAVEAVLQQSTKANGPPPRDREVGGPAASMGLPSAGRPVPDTLSDANLVIEQANLLNGKPDLSNQEIEKQAKLLLAEFLNDENEKEAIETVRTYFHPTSMERLVENLINGVLERSGPGRKKIGVLLGKLVIQHILLRKQYEAGVKSVLQFAGELMVDIPKVWDYLGELIAPMILQNAVPMSFLVDNGLLKEDGYTAKYLAGVLGALVHSVGQDKTASLWRASRMNIEDFVSKDKVNDFVTTHKFEFIQNLASEPSMLSPEVIHDELARLLVSHPKQHDEIVEWIEARVGEKKTEPWFIRVLMTAVAENAITETNQFQRDIMNERKNLLRTYLDGKVPREKQALYALQYLMHKMEHPNRVLHQIFECLYDNDIVSEEALFEWETCTDAAELEGKGVAIKSTTQFFTWLREADDDEDEA